MKKKDIVWIILSSFLGALVGAILGVFIAGVDLSLAIRISSSIGLGTMFGIILGRTSKFCEKISKD